MRSPARRRPIPKKLGFADGKWTGYGRMVENGSNGFGIPQRFAIRQRGVWVDRRWSVGARDRPNSW